MGIGGELLLYLQLQYMMNVPNIKNLELSEFHCAWNTYKF